VDCIIKKTGLGIFLLSTIVSLGAHAFESAPTSFIVTNSTYSGHEEISRQAINRTLARFEAMGINTFSKIPALNADLDAAPKGLFGQTSKNLLILGNFATDFPQYVSFMDLGVFWNVKHMSDFEHPDTQVLHFLRNYTDNKSNLASAYATCMDARAKIKYITEKAVSLWDAGSVDKALFLIGHASHTIQDSFSPAHTIRDLNPSGNYDVKNICYYGSVIHNRIQESLKDLCFHNAPDARDAIWNMGQGQQIQDKVSWPDEASIQCDKGNGYPDTDDRKQACLKNEARLARLATEKYLFLVFAHLNMPLDHRKPLASFIDSLDTRLFEGPTGHQDLDSKMAGGIMRCQGLSKNIIMGVDPVTP
jgi:hypothetical protein